MHSCASCAANRDYRGRYQYPAGYILVAIRNSGSRPLRRCIAEGAIVACEKVWAETATFFDKESQFLKAMETLGVRFTPVPQAAVIKAGMAWRHYRKNDGKRTRVAADFLIGAHAAGECDRLLTRDRGFYRSYFKSLKILDPVG